MRKSFLLLLVLVLVPVILSLYRFRPTYRAIPAVATIKLVPQPAVVDNPPVASINLVTNTIATIVKDSNSLGANMSDATNLSAIVRNDTTPDQLPELLARVRAWAAKDPEIALAEILKLPAGTERDQALIAVCYGVAERDPAAAISVAQTLKLDQRPEGVVPNLLEQWATSDFSSASDWVNNQPAGDQRNDFTWDLAFALSQTQPVDAAALVLNSIPVGSAQNKAVLMVLDQWSNKDMDGALAWANQFPEGPLRAEALQGLQHRRMASE